jgi:hypothetical protein
MEGQDETRITAGHSGFSHKNNASSLWGRRHDVGNRMGDGGPRPRECLIAKAGYQVLLFGPASSPAEVACLPARH